MSLLDKLKKEPEGKKTRQSLVDEIYKRGTIPNFITFFVTVIYVTSTASIQKNLILPVIISGLVAGIILQLIIAPVTNKFITQTASDDLDSFYNYGSDTKERTRLMKQLMALPEKIGVQIFSVFIVGVVLWIVVCRTLLQIDYESVLMFIASGIFGAYTGLVIGIESTQKVCSKHTALIVEKGVLREEVEEKHSFGTSSTKITVFHIFGPLALIDIFFMIIAWRAQTAGLRSQGLLLRVILITIINSIFYVILSTMLFKRMMVSINFIKEIMEKMNRGNLHKVSYNPTDLSNEFMYNIYLINSIIYTLQNILKFSREVSQDVIGSSNELSVISKQTAATSLEQTTGIKELLVSMEESDRLAKSIEEKIGEVSQLAKRTTDDINKGFDILTESMDKLSEIKTANEITVEGIRSLGEKISGISDIATIISSIADQTNIIAFNAELEASSAGEAGENFLLVANEIRRLTNNTIQSTNEIQKKIVEIQHSSQELLASSKNGSLSISTGNEMVSQLHSSFESLTRTSTAASYSSDEIREIVKEQTASFEQIVVTLNQIHESVENFSVSTQDISQSAENLCEISTKLKDLQPSELNREGESNE